MIKLNNTVVNLSLLISCIYGVGVDLFIAYLSRSPCKSKGTTEKIYICKCKKRKKHTLECFHSKSPQCPQTTDETKASLFVCGSLQL